MKRWQEDGLFCHWLISMRYAEIRDKDVFSFLSLGCVLFMYEAWVASKEII